uniref:Uncharacterized protein n=1 Tax=Haptolina brevifila TaxID=156173 RepID=A0A7S2ILV8_9EUKA|mmetsp:Transcript_68221/g.135214  ORF Transcript_68221/g.135214 Transcript_68221/m.135214 type:complete len:166 (+) Transcript_68221:3-500(+)
MSNVHLRRLCRWLGSRRQQENFNRLILYILTESSRYCPREDTGGNFRSGFDWQNPFHAINCTWGFHSPQGFPLEQNCNTQQVTAFSTSSERSNSTTCPRQMLCDYNTLPDGRETKPITRCNIEGYNGMHPRWLPTTKRMLAEMPGGRCPYPTHEKSQRQSSSWIF